MVCSISILLEGSQPLAYSGPFLQGGVVAGLSFWDTCELQACPQGPYHARSLPVACRPKSTEIDPEVAGGKVLSDSSWD